MDSAVIGSGFKSWLGPYLLSDLNGFLNLLEPVFSEVWRQHVRDAMSVCGVAPVLSKDLLSGVELGQNLTTESQGDWRGGLV